MQTHQARINFGHGMDHDEKGILKGVTLGGKIIT